MPTLSPPPAEPVVRLRTPPEIVRAVPQLLGFHPAASIVVLGLAGPRLRLRMTMRVDLPLPGTEEQLADHVAGRMTTERLTACVVVVFSKQTPDAAASMPASSESAQRPETVPAESPGPDPVPNRRRARQVSPRPRPSQRRAALPGAVAAFAVDAALRRAGIDVREVLRVEDDRWWSYVCELPCCPPEGLLLGSGPTSLLEVLRVAAGRPIFADRSALVASVSRADGEPTDELREAIRERVAVAGIQRLSGAAAADDLAVLQAILVRDAGLVGDPAAAGGPAGVITAEPDPAGSGDDVLAFVAVALTNLAVRDASFAWTGGPLADAAIALWRELVRRVPAPYAAAPATLLAVAAYRRGDGALADAYLRRALEDDPDYRMADLVLTSLEQGFHPSDVESALGLEVGASVPAREAAPDAAARKKGAGGRRSARRGRPTGKAGEADAG